MKVCNSHIKEEVKGKLNIIDKIILNVFKSYTYRIYKAGVKRGFNLTN